MAAHVLAPRRRTDRRKSWGLVDVVERRLMRPWMRRQPPEVEKLLVGLTRAAEHSVLWLVLAAAGGLLGGGAVGARRSTGSLHSHATRPP